MMSVRLLCSVAVLSTATLAFAHGVQVQITFDPTSGKIQTRQVVQTQSATNLVPGYMRGDVLTPPARIYVMPLLDTQVAAGNGYYTRPTDARNTFGAPRYPSGPGVAWRYEHQTSGTGWEWGNASDPAQNPNLPNLAGTNFSIQIAQGLLFWDGSNWVDPGSEQLEILRGDGTSTPLATTVTSDSGPFGSLPLSTIASATRPGATSIPHNSVSYRLLGDGVSSATPGDDGIYLLSLQISSTATYGVSNSPVLPSDTLYFLLHQNVGLDAALAAASATATQFGLSNSDIQVVPAPPALAFLLPLCIYHAYHRRRRT